MFFQEGFNVEAEVVLLDSSFSPPDKSFVPLSTEP